MTARTIQLLHVEDDPLQQKLVGHHLKSMGEFQFAIACAQGEQDAIDEFTRRPADIVIMDYQLKQGDGLSCLRALRQRHNTVPIIAVSGKATPEVAAELLRSGADDYIDKRNLNSDVLARSVRMAIARYDAWCRRSLAGGSHDGGQSRFRHAVAALSNYFLDRLDSEFWRQLAECESAIRDQHVSEAEIESAFEYACAKFIEGHAADTVLRNRLVRPLVLELQARLAE
jgi:DNA-binding response OmpR family regulator